MPSVSRLGEATEPASRWSRPMTIGAFSSPDATSSLNSQPRPRPLAVAEPADARRQPLEGDALLGHRDPAAQRLVLREELQDGPVGPPDVVGVARQGGPAEGALALAEERPDEGGHEAREVEGVGHAGRLGLRPDVVAVVEGHGARPLEGEHRPHVVGHRGHRPPRRTRRGRLPAARPPRPARGRPGRSRPARRGRTSGRSRRRSARPDGPARAPPRRRCRPGRSRSPPRRRQRPGPRPSASSSESVSRST